MKNFIFSFMGLVLFTNISCLPFLYLSKDDFDKRFKKLEAYYKKEKNKRKALDVLLVFWVNHKDIKYFTKKARKGLHTKIADTAHDIGNGFIKIKQYKSALPFLDASCMHAGRATMLIEEITPLYLAYARVEAQYCLIELQVIQNLRLQKKLEGVKKEHKRLLEEYKRKKERLRKLQQKRNKAIKA